MHVELAISTRFNSESTMHVEYVGVATIPIAVTSLFPVGS